MFSRAHIVLLAAILVSLLASLASSRIDPYFLDVTLGVGINIILAVSLNLINGLTNPDYVTEPDDGHFETHAQRFRFCRVSGKAGNDERQSQNSNKIQ